jgi:branched-chain amino acid transport system ATP-binding protein
MEKSLPREPLKKFGRIKECEKPTWESKRMLEVAGINTYYEKSHILHDVSIKIRAGELVGLLGRNGVGKSTTLKSIIGIAPPRSGSIRFDGQDILGLRPHKIAKLGIGYVPEDKRIFPNLTVRENLMIGMKHPKKTDSDKGWTISKVYQLFPALNERDSFKGRFLSGGEKQMLTIGRTLMGDPRLLLLDEPTEGLAPLVVETLIGVIAKIHQEGTAILLVEQYTGVILELAEKVFLMSKGEIVFEGSASQFRARPDLSEKYLAV